MVLNATEMQTQMEVCEEMMRGVPTCSKQEWRHKRDFTKRKKKWVGFCTDFDFCPVGAWSAGGLLPPYPAKYIQGKRLTHFLSRQEPDLGLFVLVVVLVFSCTLFERYLSGRA